MSFFTLSRHNTGLLFAIVSAVAYGTNPLFALPLYHRGFCTEAVLLLRYLPATVATAIWCLCAGEKLLLDWKHAVVIVPACSMCAASSQFLYMSYGYMDSGVASTLLFVYPLMTALLMWIFCHERLTAKIMLALMLCIAGVFLLCRKGDGSSVSLPGVLLVMGSALTYAVYLAVIGKSRGREVSSLTTLFYVMACGVVLFLVKLLISPSYSAQGTIWGGWSPLAWLCIAGLVVFPTLVSFYLVTLAVRYVGATPAAIIGAMEPLSAVAFGIMIFHEECSLRMFLGIALILCGVIVTVVGKHQETKTGAWNRKVKERV